MPTPPIAPNSTFALTASLRESRDVNWDWFTTNSHNHAIRPRMSQNGELYLALFSHESLITLFNYSKDYYAFLDEDEADKLASSKSRK